MQVPGGGPTPGGGPPPGSGPTPGSGPSPSGGPAPGGGPSDEPDMLVTTDMALQLERADLICTELQAHPPGFVYTKAAETEFAENIILALGGVAGYESDLQAMKGPNANTAAIVFLHRHLCRTPMSLRSVRSRVGMYPAAGGAYGDRLRQTAKIDTLAKIIGPSDSALLASPRGGAPPAGGSPTGGGHDPYYISTAADELAKRSQLKAQAHATADTLQNAVDHILAAHPPPTDPHTGLPGVAPFEATAAGFVGKELTTIVQAVDSPQFQKDYPQVAALRYQHITASQANNFPNVSFLRKMQQGAIASLQTHCVLKGLSSLTSSTAKMLAIVFGDWSLITFDDFNFGTKLPYLGSSTREQTRYQKICAHIVDVMILVHPVLGRSTLEAQMAIICDNIDKAVLYEEYQEPGVTEANLRTMGVAAINRFFVDLGMLVDQSRIVTLTGAPPVTALDVVELTCEAGDDVPEWQSDDAAPIFASLMATTKAGLQRALAIKRRSALFGAAAPAPGPAPAPPGGALPPIPKKKNLAQAQDPGADGTDKANLLTVPRPLSAPMSWKRFASMPCHKGIVIIDEASAGKGASNICMEECAEAGCPKCTYGTADGATKGSREKAGRSCNKLHLSGSAADGWKEPMEARHAHNHTLFLKQRAAGGVSNQGPWGPKNERCSTMQTWTPMPEPEPKDGKGKGGRAKGGRGRGRRGGRGAGA